MLDLLLLAIALSMDAAAVSIGLGARYLSQRGKTMGLCALYFGLFQGVMPLIGYFAGLEVLNRFFTYTDWLAAGVLIVLGLNMIRTSLTDDDSDPVPVLSQLMLFSLAIATSIDALAAGFALIVFSINIWLACLIIALVTCLFSAFGAWLGRHGGTWLESKAGWLGGIVLIGLGVKVILM